MRDVGVTALELPAQDLWKINKIHLIKWEMKLQSYSREVTIRGKLTL